MTAVVVGALPQIGPAVVTLGVFDGVHVGHRQTIRETTRAAMERGARSVAVVFSPHPDEVIRPGARVPRLLPPEETLDRLQRTGIDHAVELRFDDAVRAMAPEEFLAALAPAIDLRAIVMGAGTAFGRGRSGTPDRVAEIGARRGFDVVEVEPLVLDGEPVSSSRVRGALANGDLRLVHRLLESPPLLRGTVVPGDRRGRTLGFPTANLSFEAYTPALPARGIYLGRVSARERGVGPGHPALVSVGVRPTFHDNGRVLVEAYLLDWDGDLYGATVDVELVERIRDERRFDSSDALVEQMRADERDARARIGAVGVPERTRSGSSGTLGSVTETNVEE